MYYHVRWDGPQLLDPPDPLLSWSRELRIHNGQTCRPPRWFRDVRAVRGQAYHRRGTRSSSWDAGDRSEMERQAGLRGIK